MIIWSGLGILVPVIAFGVCLIMNFALDAQFGKGYYESHQWAVGVSLALGGLLSLAFGLILIKPVQTGPTGVLSPPPVRRTRHSIFFVPMHWAGAILALIGVGVAIADLVK